MAGYPDREKRARVRKHLMTKTGQSESDNEAARVLGVSKVLVTLVRRQLLADGLVPFPEKNKHLGDRDFYQPGASARGGYVFDDKGRVVQKSVWEATKAAKRRSRPGRATKRKAATG